jgi:type I restriction enzyme, S subunit
MTWPKVKLGEVLRHRKGFIQIDDVTPYKRCRVQLHAQGVVLRDQVPGSEIKTKKQQVCKAGEFLVAEIDAKHGGYGMVPDDLEGAIVSSHYFLFGTDDARIDRRYLGWFIRTPAFFEQVAAQGSTNYAAIRPGHVLEYEIPLPPLAEQRQLVARIDALAAKIDEAKRLRAEADQASSALVSSMHLSLASDRVVRVGDVLVFHEDRVPITAGDEYPQVGVKGFGGGLFARETLTATQTTYKAFNRLHAGMLVLSQVKGWEGAIAVCPGELAGRFASPEYRTFRCKAGELDPDYLAMIVPTEWFWSRLATLTRGVGARRERIRPELFVEMTLPMPTLAHQRHAMKVCERLQATLPDKALIPEQFEAMLPAILDRAFRGEL